MKNQWLEDFRSSLTALGKTIYDYQEGISGSILDVARELIRVAKQVVREFGDKDWDSDIKDMYIKNCILHMTKLDTTYLPDGKKITIPGTSLIDKINLMNEDSFSYCVLHMTDYLRSQMK